MELRDYVRILRTYWLGILVLTVFGAGAAFAWSLMQAEVYTAEASGYVRTGDDPDAANASLAVDQLARSKVTSYIDIGSWHAVAESVIDDLNLDATPDELIDHVDVTNPLGTVVIRVAASAATPEDARDLAEAWLSAMSVEIDRAEGNGTAGSSPVGLYAGDSARLPTSPSSPNLRLNLALGALLGLAAGIGYATLRHSLDRRVRDPREIERIVNTSVVGSLPYAKDLGSDRRVLSLIDAGETATPLAESLRELRTNLQFMDVDSPPRTIVVTSPLPGDGKSTLAANLAVSLAAAGSPVVLVDADLRRPTIAGMFGLPDGAGLTDVLAGRSEIVDVVHNADPTGNLVVMTAGRIPPNPSEVVGSVRMRDLLRTLSEHAFVIVDSPPLIPVTDGAVLSTAADGALVVVSAGKTTFDMLDKAKTNLDKANARMLGIVLNRVPRTGAQAAYYGYQFRGEYAAVSRDTT